MERAELNRNCWISAAIAGVLVLLFTSGLGGMPLPGGLFLGALAGLFVGYALNWLLCHDPEAPDANGLRVGMSREEWERQGRDHQRDTLEIVPEPAPLRRPAPAAGLLPIVAGAMPARQVAAGADDLKRIKGVGPKLSDWLHDNGVTRYAQIAGWGAADIADFAQRLGRMGGRIEADDWVGQAQLLAAGGETAHSRRVDGGESS